MICQCSMTRSNCSSFCFRMHDLYFFSIRLNYQLESVRKRYLSIVYLLVQSGQPFSLRFVYTLLTCVIQNSASLTHIPCLTVSVFFPEDMTRNWNNIEIDVPVDWERWHFEFKLSVWEIRGRGIKKLIIRKVDRRTSCNIHDDVFKENASQIYPSCLLVENITDIPSMSSCWEHHRYTLLVSQQEDKKTTIMFPCCSSMFGLWSRVCVFFWRRWSPSHELRRRLLLQDLRRLFERHYSFGTTVLIALQERKSLQTIT